MGEPIDTRAKSLITSGDINLSDVGGVFGQIKAANDFIREHVDAACRDELTALVKQDVEAARRYAADAYEQIVERPVAAGAAIVASAALALLTRKLTVRIGALAPAAERNIMRQAAGRIAAGEEKIGASVIDKLPAREANHWFFCENTLQNFKDLVKVLKPGDSGQLIGKIDSKTLRVTYLIRGAERQIGAAKRSIYDVVPATGRNALSEAHFNVDTFCVWVRTKPVAKTAKKVIEFVLNEPSLNSQTSARAQAVVRDLVGWLNREYGGEYPR